MQYAYAYNPQGVAGFIAYLSRTAALAGFSATGTAALTKGQGSAQAIVDIQPSLYGYRGCTCLQNYHSKLSQLSSGPTTSYSFSNLPVVEGPRNQLQGYCCGFNFRRQGLCLDLSLMVIVESRLSQQVTIHEATGLNLTDEATPEQAHHHLLILSQSTGLVF